MKKTFIPLITVGLLLAGCVNTEINPPDKNNKAECIKIMKAAKSTPEYQEYQKRLKKGEAAGWVVAIFAGPLSSGTLVEAAIAGTPDGEFEKYSKRFKTLKCSPANVELYEILDQQR
jgi:hypothetical protein